VSLATHRLSMSCGWTCAGQRLRDRLSGVVCATSCLDMRETTLTQWRRSSTVYDSQDSHHLDCARQVVSRLCETSCLVSHNRDNVSRARQVVSTTCARQDNSCLAQSQIDMRSSCRWTYARHCLDCARLELSCLAQSRQCLAYVHLQLLRMSICSSTLTTCRFHCALQCAADGIDNHLSRACA